MSSSEILKKTWICVDHNDLYKNIKNLKKTDADALRFIGSLYCCFDLPSCLEWNAAVNY